MRRLLASLVLPWLVSCAWDPGPEGAESPILVDPAAALDLDGEGEPLEGGAGAVAGPFVLGIEARISVDCRVVGDAIAETFRLAPDERWGSEGEVCGLVAGNCWTRPGEVVRSWWWGIACP